MIYYAGPKNRAEIHSESITHCTSYDVINAKIPGVVNCLRRRANILSKGTYTAEQHYRHFVSHNPEYICIDEWLWRRFKRKKVLLDAIKMVKERRPEIGVWLWVGIFTPMRDLLRVSPHVDMLLIEQYTAFTCPLLLWFFYKRRYKRFAKKGIENKVMFVLGANQVDRLDVRRALKFEDPNYWLPYAKEDTFRKVVPYVYRNCPGPGVGLYDAGAQDWKVGEFVREANKYGRS